MADLNKGAHKSPNIQSDFNIYELENKACDPKNLIGKFLKSKFNWENKFVLDVGCGTGYHLPLFSKSANHVFGIEPHDDSRLEALKRVYTKRLTNVSILKGTAEMILLPDNSVDLAHARFAYFWGAGCEKGLDEMFRVLKPGGLFVMIDNNLNHGTFGSWVKESFNFNDQKQSETNSFWASRGFDKKEIVSEWSFTDRIELEKVLQIEFPSPLYQKIIAQHQGNSIDYTFNLFYKIKT